MNHPDMPNSTAFKFHITYFKTCGKFYTSCEQVWIFNGLGQLGFCDMESVKDYVCTLRDHGGKGALPGLHENTEGWEGFILVDCERGYPILILPNT